MYGWPFQVIYGDTDSVMVNFYVNTVAEGMKIGADAAAFVSEKFIKPIKIEFEKVNAFFAFYDTRVPPDNTG